MKKTRIVLGAALSLVVALGVSAVAVGCGDPQSEPEAYTLAYEKGTDENGTVPETKSYAAGETVMLASADTFTKESYTFTKWLDGTAEYDAGATFTMPERNVTLKAKWQENKPQPEPSSDKMVLGENVYTLGADDTDPDDDTLGRVITFQGKADTNYTFEMELKGLGSLLSVYDSKETYDAWGEPLLSGDTLSMVLTTDGGGTLSLYLNNGTYDAESYDADTNTVTITVTEGANVRYAVAFYNKEEAVGSPADFVFEITWGKSFNQEYADDGTNKFPVAPEEEGYEFIGWFDENGKEFTADTVVKSQKLLVAKYVYGGDGKTELTTGENELTLGAKDKDAEGELARTVTFTGKANTAYTFEYVNDAYGPVSVYASREAYEDNPWEGILDGGTTVNVFETDADGKISFYVNGAAFDAMFYSQAEYTICLTVTEGAHIQYTVAFYEDETSVGSPMGMMFDITWGNSFTQEYADDNTKTFPEGPDKAGYNFVGWFDENDEQFTADTVVKSEKMLVAKYIKTELTEGENEFVLGVHDIKNYKDFMGEYQKLGREITFYGTAGEVYTLTFTHPQIDMYYSLAVYESEQAFENSENAILSSSENTVVVKIPESGSISFFITQEEEYFEDDYNATACTCTITVTKGGTITYTVSFQTGNRPYLVTVEEGGTVAENEFYTAPELSGKRFVGWFIVVDGEMTEEFTSDTVVNSNLELAPKYEDTETTVNTLTADELTNSLASYPDFVKKGETLTITGEAELTDVTANGNGIFVVLSKGGSAYVMPAYNNWVYGSQDGQHENTALNFVISTAEYGFTDSVSGGVWDNFNAMILKKTCAVK